MSPMTPDQHRAFYLNLLREGMSIADATREANEAYEESLAGAAAVAAAPKRRPDPAAIQTTASQMKPMSQIPPDWENMTWPELKSLATQVNKGAEPENRADAKKILNKAMAAAQASKQPSV